ncbi:transposase-like protein [Rhizobium lentis]|uniref:Transposase-like protein n=1 Tax=Rhizobium lentis TaxID=1138194 RepID=A0A7W8XGT8_9HYPH|nr:transposase-like protein [Rhizobium lentis]MBB5552074.1 transposase-like protein [Rhizobium lentis]MBB5562612.1 transposase-like protein [Rhizobium lentis]MBB5569841.1 transposase-like protein [Rhizobium lentis]
MSSPTISYKNRRFPPQAAKRLLVRPLKKKGLSPKRIVSDKLRSYGAARRDRMPGRRTSLT